MEDGEHGNYNPGTRFERNCDAFGHLRAEPYTSGLELQRELEKSISPFCVLLASEFQCRLLG